MSALVVVLAAIVALQYFVIAIDVVPRFGRLAPGPRTGLITTAKWGAIAFFLGCALTHLQISYHALRGPTVSSGPHLALEHVLPHLAQVLGGAAFIVIAKRRLELRLTTKDGAAALRDLERRFRATFERSPTGIALLSAGPLDGGRFLQVNPALGLMVGLTSDEIQRERTYEDLVHPSDRAMVAGKMSASLGGERDETELEHRYAHRDGHDVWVQVRSSLVRGDRGEPLFNMLQVRDITSERHHADQLQHLADHDALTGVYNRRRFEEELDQAVAFAGRYRLAAVLLVIDLDQFKYINDTYGHLAGDELLRSVTKVLAGRLRDTDTVGRLGGDEFGVICPHTSMAGGAILAKGLLEAMRTQACVKVGDRVVRVTASIGARLIPGGDALTTGADLLQQADIAMYEAKESGRDRVATVDEHNVESTQIRSRLMWSERIRDALEADGFMLWEQPILDLASGRCDRSELLLRMRDTRDGSAILPGAFLPVAERFGQIQAIDRWVSRRAIELLGCRQQLGSKQVLEVNLSGVSLTDESLIDDIVCQINASSIDPTKLIFEVTETAAIANFDEARRFAARITDLGCQFALDDFGSGFGSFYYLKHLPFDGVKIDGDFVKDLPASKDDQLIVQAIAHIAAGMGKDTTAEFVQDDATIEMLRSYGVNRAQGFYIGEPRPVHWPGAAAAASSVRPVRRRALRPAP